MEIELKAKTTVQTKKKRKRRLPSYGTPLPPPNVA